MYNFFHDSNSFLSFVISMNGISDATFFWSIGLTVRIGVVDLEYYGLGSDGYGWMGRKGPVHVKIRCSSQLLICGSFCMIYTFTNGFNNLTYLFLDTKMAIQQSLSFICSNLSFKT